MRQVSGGHFLISKFRWPRTRFESTETGSKQESRLRFYAGARSLIVSNWEVNSDSAVTLMVGTFAALAADPKLSHAEALRKSMLAMIDQHPEQADPKYWAPFVVVGEPAKPAN